MLDRHLIAFLALHGRNGIKIERVHHELRHGGRETFVRRETIDDRWRAAWPDQHQRTGRDACLGRELNAIGLGIN